MFIQLPFISLTPTCSYNSHLFLYFLFVHITPIYFFNSHLFIKLPFISLTPTCSYNSHLFLYFLFVHITPIYFFNSHLFIQLQLIITPAHFLVMPVLCPSSLRFFHKIASDYNTADVATHSLSYLSESNTLSLHRLLWVNQEKIGDYLSSSRLMFISFIDSWKYEFVFFL